MGFIVNEISRDKRIGDKLGIGQFESLLGIIKVTGAVPDEICKKILELQQIRHIIVHRGSYADINLITRCPWLGYKAGDRVRINREQFNSLSSALIDYLKIFYSRAQDIYGEF